MVSWGAERLIALINSKLSNFKYVKYLTSAVDIVTRAVKTTYQTYVASLKDKNAFSKEAQKESLIKARDIAISQMSSEVKKFLSENFGDIKEWISNTIESVIYDLKNKFAGEKTDEKA